MATSRLLPRSHRLGPLQHTFLRALVVPFAWSSSLPLDEISRPSVWIRSVGRYEHRSRQVGLVQTPQDMDWSARCVTLEDQCTRASPGIGIVLHNNAG